MYSVASVICVTVYPFTGSPVVVSCKETQGRVLCVYKHINGVPSPHVFIDYKEASSSQYVRLFVRGRYYNAIGAQNCSEDSYHYYYAGVLLIQPQSLPAHVEVSFTKNRTSTTLCNADSFPSYNTTVVKQGNHIRHFATYFLFLAHVEFLFLPAGSCSCSASTCIQHKIKANLAQVARLLDTVSELLTQ